MGPSEIKMLLVVDVQILAVESTIVDSLVNEVYRGVLSGSGCPIDPPIYWSFRISQGLLPLVIAGPTVGV